MLNLETFVISSNLRNVKYLGTQKKILPKFVYKSYTRIAASRKL